MVAQGTPCLGPITQSGCGAICPAYDRGCYGCFGPATQPNVVSLTAQFQRDGMTTPEIVRGLRLFNACAPEFRLESDRLSASTETQP